MSQTKKPVKGEKVENTGETTGEAPDKRIEKVIREIKKFYAVGKHKRDKKPNGSSAAADAASQRTMAYEKERCRKAVQFARKYDQEDLEELCSLLREHKPIFGYTHLFILVTISDPEKRKQFQELCIKNRWSQVEMWRQKKLRFASCEDHGGRPREKRDELDRTLLHLAEICTAWQRWQKNAMKGQLDQAQTLLEQLPASVKQAVQKLDQQLSDLKGKVDAELKIKRDAASAQRS